MFKKEDISGIVIFIGLAVNILVIVTILIYYFTR